MLKNILLFLNPLGTGDIIFILLAIIVPIFIVVGLIILIFYLVRKNKEHSKLSEIRNEQEQTRKTLGETLKFYREKNNMTQEFIAEELGVSRQAVSKWETDLSEPSTSNLIALARLYKVSADELLKTMKNG